MATITTLRPSATASGTGWSAQPSGTLHGVTSDNSDSTYALWSGTGTALALSTPLDAPPSGERRHQVRLRARGEDGDAWWAVRLASGRVVAGASAQFTASPTTVIGSWGTGVPYEGSIVLQAYVDGQSAGVKINELYIDVDTREAPSIVATVVNGAGAVTTLVTDTATPTLRATSIDTDGLNFRQWHYWVTQGSALIWDSGIISGPPPDQMTSPLANGTYTAHLQISTTIGANGSFVGNEATIDFTVANNLVPRPVQPTAAQIDGTPFYEIEACAPYVADLDGEVGYIEVQRADCPVDGVPTTLTTVAMLGPLATDECAAWTDYSVPRSGIGGSCEHEPYECCSYYRTRTIGRIDGSIVISLWSDVEDLGVPSGAIVAWPGTASSIPAGWSRVADLDDRYPKGIATAGTQPGSTGGATSHTHTAPGHTHDVSHSHTTSGATSAAVGTIMTSPNTAGTTASAATHTHTVPTPTGTETVASGSTAQSVSSVSNEPDRLSVVWISSDGTPAGVPATAVTPTADVALAGWTDYAPATGRFLKGAAAAGDGGATGAGALGNHVHALGAHTHTGTSHTHAAQVTGTAAQTLAPVAGPNAVIWQSALHSHPITYGATNTAALASGGAADSNATSRGTDQDPPFRNVRIRENTSGAPSLPVGLICAWRGSLGSIPDNWQVADGTNGTVDLIGRYPKGATTSVGTAGGSAAGHTHATPSHTHTTSGHAHTMAIGAATVATANVSATSAVAVSLASHTHTHADTASTTPTVGGSTSGILPSTVTEPPYEEVAFIQMTAEPAPPQEPELVCLTWPQDQGLIRTMDAAGPIWAPILGRFTWDRDRPFTSALGVTGGTYVTSATPGGRNLSMSTAVETEAELRTLLAVLARPLVLISPADSTETWAAPVATSIRIVKIGRLREVTADFIATGPQPDPQFADIGA